MSIGYQQITQIRRVEKQAEEMGFMFCYPKAGWDDTDRRLALKPKDAESLPIYCRDAQLFSGNLDDVENFLHGIKWARDYDYMIRLSDDKKRARKEQDVRNKQLIDKLKNQESERMGP